MLFLGFAFFYPVLFLGLAFFTLFLGLAFFCPVFFLGLVFPNILCARVYAYDCLPLGSWLFLTASFALFVFQQKALIIADEQAGEREGDNHSYQA